MQTTEAEQRDRVKKKAIMWRQFTDMWVVLFTDPDTGSRFVLCREVQAQGRAEVKVWSVSGRARAQAFLTDTEFRTTFMGFGGEVVEYEALKHFPDHHRRTHWKLNCVVTFFGTEHEMDLLSRLTSERGLFVDSATGLVAAKSLFRAKLDEARAAL